MMTEIITDNAFYLPKPTTSIFTSNELVCREYPTMNLMYGFINNQMGIKLRKHIAKTYPDEQTHYKKYIKNFNYKTNYIEVSYYLPKHGWGRINAVGSLTLSVFHRSSRHSFAKENYLDFDMINAQVQLLLCFAEKNKCPTDGLKEYCENPKLMRNAIVEHYKLQDIQGDDGYILTAYEQAKNLPFRLAFGGGINTWKQEYVKSFVNDMPMIENLIKTLNILKKKIVYQNPHIKQDILKYDTEKKTDDEIDRSVMGQFCQTWERIIQEECISYLCRTFNIQINDIVPYTQVICILGELLAVQTIHELEVIQQTCNNCTIDCIHAFYQ